MQQAKWNSEFEVGIVGIDRSHYELLNGAKDVFALLDNEDSSENRAACAKALDKLRDDMLRHLDEEEFFMQYIGYEGFKRHKRQHNRARKELLEFEDELVRYDYAPDHILKVMGKAIGWMTAHVPEDMAINGRGYQRNIPVMSDVFTKLEMAVAEVVRSIFHLNTDLLDEHFSGEGLEDATYHELHYLSAQDERLMRYVVAFEKKLIERSAGTLVSKRSFIRSQIAYYAMKEITRMIFLEVGTYFRDDIAQFNLIHEGDLTQEEALARFKADPPVYGMLFETEAGRFAICFNIDDHIDPQSGRCPSTRE